MRTLVRPIGLGLAARGDPKDVLDWSRRARDAGLDSVWIHDSYFERDAISFATSVAGGLARDDDAGTFRVALGAVNPYTRHPVVLAMTGSALDEILPGRIVMGIGTGLPLRLKQMGIPYEPESAVERVSTAMDQIRALWAGERLPSATPGLPPIQPMFPPTHRIPLVVAAYRREFVDLAGQKADGYLARPAESIPSLRGILERLRAAAAAAGRDPAAIESAGYLLSLVDRTRREALNRAKREPFVIYMMSVLGDISLRRAGFDRDLRDRIAAAWRAEDFTLAGNLIPDELLDAFMLCGTREDVAAKALAFAVETGLGLPLLQPVLQEERQIDELIAAAALYAELPASARWVAPAAGDALVAAVDAGSAGTAGPADAATIPAARPAGSLADDRRLGPLEAARRRLGATWEILRPFAYTASVIPVLAGAALAGMDGRFEALPFFAALLGAVLLHSGTNVVNEIYDVRQGIDTIVSPRASHAIVKGRMSERAAFAVAGLAFALAVGVGIYLLALRGPAIAGLGILGLVGGWGYTAPPLQYKYRALGVPLVFLLMGPLMVEGTYFAVTGGWSATALVLSVPVGLLVAAILHGNEWRDISEDTRAGIVTLSSRVGKEWAHYGYVALVLGAYITLGVAVAFALLPPQVVLAILSLPFLAQVVRSAELGATGQARAIAMIDLQTARLHLAFGAFLVLGLLLASAVRG
ncbi:MAG TPA: LLM class flavin-dependent oxidoreductase [Candidatus Sulfomarinibacteraceae bacterium]|nr:LLM class flavin-dependent oxidoreductase [Candidatus Sulfomarinibacteraceae bacterium]